VLFYVLFMSIIYKAKASYKAGSEFHFKL